MVSGRATEVNDFSPVTNDGNSSRNDLLDEARVLTFAPVESKNGDTRSGGDRNQSAGAEQENAEQIALRVRNHGDNPEVQRAYKEFQKATKDLDPKMVEDCLNLASDLAESGIKLPGMLKADQSTDQLQRDEDTANEIAMSSVFQTLLRKFSNPLVIKDVINIGKDLANIAMSPQGRSLIANFRSLVVHLKEA